MFKSAILISTLFLAQNVLASIEDSYQERKDHLEAFYKDLHENPELSLHETRTASKVAEEMRSIGLEVTEGVGGGVVGLLKNGPGPVTLVRAELDALPVTEETGAPFKSKTPGVMHACAHDFHATALMGTAYAMAKNKESWKGTLVFVAQPAEEVVKGAKNMINAGIFKKFPKPQQTIALHTYGHLKKGVIGITPGYALANVDSVTVTFRGVGTHGSTPEIGIDPFIQAAEYTLKLQTLLGREKNASQPAVISVGSMHGGTKHNIIPDEVVMQITVRSYDPGVRKMIKRRMVEIAKGIASTNNAPEPKVEFPEETDALHNDIRLTESMKKLFIKKFGADKVVDMDPVMGGEDFGQFGDSAKVPTFFYWLGERNEKQPTVNNHSAKYLPDYNATMPFAVESMTTALLSLHGK